MTLKQRNEILACAASPNVTKTLAHPCRRCPLPQIQSQSLPTRPKPSGPPRASIFSAHYSVPCRWRLVRFHTAARAPPRRLSSHTPRPTATRGISEHASSCSSTRVVTAEPHTPRLDEQRHGLSRLAPTCTAVLKRCPVSEL
jgi:hypothetical protein